MDKKLKLSSFYNIYGELFDLLIFIYNGRWQLYSKDIPILEPLDSLLTTS